MRRIIKYNYIKEINQYLNTQLINLKQEQRKLLLDIVKVKECYQGKDSDIIVAKYSETANNLNTYIMNIENYIKYFDWLCGNYHQSQSKALSNLANVLPQNETDSLLNTTLNLDNISLGMAGDNNG